MQVFRGTVYLDDDMIENVTLAVFGNAKALDDWLDEITDGAAFFAGLRIV